MSRVRQPAEVEACPVGEVHRRKRIDREDDGVPDETPVLHVDFVKRKPQAFCLPAPRLQPPPEQLLRQPDVLIQLIFMLGAGLSVEEGPTDEVADIVPFDLGQGRVAEPSAEVVLRIRDVVTASLKERTASVASRESGVSRWALQVGSAGEVDEDVEGGLKMHPSCDGQGYAREVSLQRGEGGDGVDDAEGDDGAQGGDAGAYEDVVEGRRPYHDDYDLRGALL